MQGKVEICGVNTSKLKVLKNEETLELLKRTKQGDMDAREALIAGNLRLVLSVIQRFGGRIWIDPDYSGGTRFCFTHPLSTPQRKEKHV